MRRCIILRRYLPPALPCLCVLAFAGCSSPPASSDASADVADVIDDVVSDAMTDAPTVSPTGGSVDLLHFAVFGDMRPASSTSTYPTDIVQQVVTGFSGFTPQFAIATGDYMDGSYSLALDAQLDMLQPIEAMFLGHIFHAMGNHECLTNTDSNCPLGNESANVVVFRQRLAADEPALYYDFSVHTSMGDAHFVVTAPNAWDSNQASWFTTALAAPAMYTFVVAHEGPNASPPLPPGSAPIESAIASRAGGVTLRLYGHTHEYRRWPRDTSGNGVIVGIAGAPLSATGMYGFVMVDQLASGNIQVTSYGLGNPPMMNDTWSVSPSGASL